MKLSCKLRLHWLLDDVGVYQHAPGGWWRCKSCDRKLFKDNAVYMAGVAKPNPPEKPEQAE